MKNRFFGTGRERGGGDLGHLDLSNGDAPPPPPNRGGGGARDLAIEAQHVCRDVRK